jgi:hypothetical protein
MSFFGDTDNYKNVMDQLDELNNRITTNNKKSIDDKKKILELLQDINLNKITKFLSDSCEKLKTTNDELSEETQKIDTSNEALNKEINDLQQKIDNLNKQLEEKEQTISKLNEQLSESKTISKSQMEKILEKIRTIPQDKIELTELLEQAERIKKEIDNVKDCNGKDFQKEPEAKPEEIDQTGTTEKTKNSNDNYMGLKKGFFNNLNNNNNIQGGKKRKTRFALQSKKRNNNKMKISKKNKQDNSESETRNITSSIANIAGSKDTNPQYTSSSLAGSIKKRGRKSKKINKTKKSRKSKKSKKTKKSRKSKKSKKSKK